MRLLFLAMTTIALMAPATVRDDEFTPLLTSDDLDQLELVGFGPDTITIKDKEIHLTGKPNGYFATRKAYENYRLKFEWKYERPEGFKDGDKFNGNSGVLVHIDGPHKVWPKCVEVQLAYAEAGHIFAINGSTFKGKTDREALKKAMKPVGQWNDEEIICRDGSITCTINGVQVATGTEATPQKGTIGFQSEGVPIDFRFIRIKTLD